jgi:hypothetical protein
VADWLDHPIVRPEFAAETDAAAWRKSLSALAWQSPGGGQRSRRWQSWFLEIPINVYATLLVTQS